MKTILRLNDEDRELLIAALGAETEELYVDYKRALRMKSLNLATTRHKVRRAIKLHRRIEGFSNLASMRRSMVAYRQSDSKRSIWARKLMSLAVKRRLRMNPDLGNPQPQLNALFTS